LGRLLDEAVALDPQFKQFADFTDSLTDQFWAQHYPGGDLQGCGSDYDMLREQTALLVDLILQITLGGKPS